MWFRCSVSEHKRTGNAKYTVQASIYFSSEINQSLQSFWLWHNEKIFLSTGHLLDFPEVPRTVLMSMGY